MDRLEIREFLTSLMREDLGRGDLFSQICDDGPVSVFAHIKAKESGIFSGEVYAKELCDMYRIECNFLIKDGKPFSKDSVLLELRGRYVEILKIERSLLNLLQHSSGIATHTRRYVNKLEGYNVMLLDTRKTRALLRGLEKYSVRNGGAINHRFGLDSMLMLKDTHLAHINDLQSFIDKARKNLPFGTSIEIEVDSVELAREAFDADVDIVMCDNMSLASIKEVVSLRNYIGSKALIEASGNVTLDNIVEIAKCGVDAISSGSLIHKAVWLDMSMKVF